MTSPHHGAIYTTHVVLPKTDIEDFAGEEDVLIDYALLRARCCRAYKSPLDMKQLILDSAQLMRTKSTEVVKARALAGDLDDALDLGMR